MQTFFERQVIDNFSTIGYCIHMSEIEPLLIPPYAPILSNPCHITFEPIFNKRTEKYRELFELGAKDPKAALAQIRGGESSPEIANLKAFLHLKAKELPQAELAIEQAYYKYEGYLPAMVNYAELCLRRKKIDEISEIFPSFDLTLLLPEKKIFHFSEFRGFMVTMGMYHLAKGLRSEAEGYYVLAVKADPLHPSVADLEKKLFRFQWLKKLVPW